MDFNDRAIFCLRGGFRVGGGGTTGSVVMMERRKKREEEKKDRSRAATGSGEQRSSPQGQVKSDYYDWQRISNAGPTLSESLVWSKVDIADGVRI